MLLNRWKVQRLLGRVVGVVAGDSSEFAVKTICTVSDEENARLIAAAPEMYNWLKAIEDIFRKGNIINVSGITELLARIDGGGRA